MTFKRFLLNEGRRLANKRILTIVIIFFILQTISLLFGLLQYKNVLEEKEKFLKYEKLSAEQLISWTQLGTYGFHLLYVPPSLSSLFDAGPVLNAMTAHIDNSERMKIYSSVKGQSAFKRFSLGYFTHTGLFLIFGSILILLYGFSGTYNHSWVMFMSEKVGRKKLFLWILISRIIYSLLFCLAIALIMVAFFVLFGFSTSIGPAIIYILLICLLSVLFLLVGMIAGLFKRSFNCSVLLIIFWIFFCLLIPFEVLELSKAPITKISSEYSIDEKNHNILFDFERDVKNKIGTFDESERGSEFIRRKFLTFKNNGFKEMMNGHKEIREQMSKRALIYQYIASVIPTTFLVSTTIEISGKGFNGLIDFNEYTQKVKERFFSYYAENQILSKTPFKDRKNFLMEEEKVFKGESTLPGNFGVGLLLTLMIIAGLLFIYYLKYFGLFRFQANGSRKVSHEFKKDVVTVIFTQVACTLHNLKRELQRFEIKYITVPPIPSLPGNYKVKHLFDLFMMEVPEVLSEVSGRLVQDLDEIHKGMVIIEIVRRIDDKHVFIFDNFCAGKPEALQEYFKEFLEAEKIKKTLVYFTNSSQFPRAKGTIGIDATD